MKCTGYTNTHHTACCTTSWQSESIYPSSIHHTLANLWVIFSQADMSESWPPLLHRSAGQHSGWQTVHRQVCTDIQLLRKNKFKKSLAENRAQKLRNPLTTLCRLSLSHQCTAFLVFFLTFARQSNQGSCFDSWFFSAWCPVCLPECACACSWCIRKADVCVFMLTEINSMASTKL